METLFAAVFLSLSTNLDNFAIAVAYSMRNLAIALPANLLIAGLSGGSTFLAMSLGSRISSFFAPEHSNTLGSSILIAIGLTSLWNVAVPKKKVDQESSQLAGNENLETAKARNCISLKEALVLGLALTITNFGTGVGAGMSRLSVVLTSSLSFFSSLLTISCGSYFGILFANFLGRRLEFIAGVLLVSLGVYECWF